jgi:hypothetical protein
MNSVYCKICDNTFLSNTHKGKIQPWDCPKCNKDNDENIQRDLNELFKINGLFAIEKLESRIDRLDHISKMMWKKEQIRNECLLLY